MATTKITDLTAYTDPINTDVLPIVDVTSDVTKKVSIANVMKNASLGSAAAPGISFDGDPNTGIYSPGANQVAISTDGTARLTASTTAITAAIPVDVLLGSASTPSYTFTGDLNTGIYSPGADQVAISTNGTGRLFVDASGRVGIGVATPSDTFHVAGGARIGANDTSTAALEIGTGATGDRIALIDLTGDTTYSDFGLRLIRQSGANGNSELRHRGTGSLIFQSFDAGNITFQTSATERLRIDSSGRVGIGTSSPSYLLTAQGTSASINVKDPGDNSTARASRYIWSFDDGDGASINATRNTGETAADAYLTFRTGGITNAQERLRITSTGNVGIGTSAPSTLLEIASNATNQTLPGIPTLRITNTDTTAVANDNVGSVEFFSKDASDPDVVTGFVRNIATSAGTIYDLTFGTKDVSIGSDATEKVRITGAGRVGIGTTSPGYVLDVRRSSAGDVVAFTGSTDGGRPLKFVSADNGIFLGAQWTRDIGSGSGIHAWAINGTERARITSDGKLLVGTASTSANARALFQATSANSSGSANIYLARGSAPADGADLGAILFSDSGHAASSVVYAARDGGTWTSGTSQPTRLVFSTTADGASSPTERMRITQAGHLLIGQTSTSIPGSGNTTEGTSIQAAGQLFISKTSGPAGTFNRSTSDGSVIDFRREGLVVGSISVTTTATAYNTSSDYRLKENVTPVTDGITRLQQLKPSRFNFNTDPTKTVDGFLAHEVQTVVPEAITGEKDAVDEDGNPLYQGIDQSKLVPLLTAALQEAIGRIETLEAEVAALKAS